MRDILYIGSEPRLDYPVIEELRRLGYAVEYASSEIEALKVVFSVTKTAKMIVASIDVATYTRLLADGSLDTLNMPIVFIPSIRDDSFEEQVRRNWRYACVSRDAGVSEIDKAIRALSAEFGERNREDEGNEVFRDTADAFVLHEIICDSEGTPVDFRFLDADGNFLRRVGMKKEDLIGKTALEVFPNIEPVWIETFGRVALTGIPETITHYAVEFDRYYEARAYSSKKGQFMALYIDLEKMRGMKST